MNNEYVKLRCDRDTGRWRLLDLEYLDPYMNLAVEEAILIAVEKDIAPNTVRIWRNSNAAVLGRFQHVSSGLNLKACIRYGTVIVRRFTGGGAVYQDYGNINWTVVISKRHPLISRDHLILFQFFSQPIIEALKKLGVNVRFKPPNSIQVNNKKVSGMAAYIKRKAILCHGTLLVNANLNILKEISVPREKNTIKDVGIDVTTLQRELNTYISISTVKEALIKGFNKAYGTILEKRGLLKEEEELAQTFYEKKYLLTEWNFML